MKLRLPSLVELEYNRLPKRAKKNAIAYLKYRIRDLKLSLDDAKSRIEFKFAREFLYGRKVEAEEILELLIYLEKKNRKT